MNMSFPGRPPFGLPSFAVPGATMAGGGPFNPHMPGGVFVPTQVGLIPGPPGGIMPRMTTSMHIRNNQSMSIPPILSESEPEKNDGGPEAPKTTVFVGNISEKAPDVLIRQLLARCGIVLNWKRVQGASGNLQAFGFCEYKEPENTLRAIRLLHEMTLGDKNLLVKVDAKTRALLDTYLSEKNKQNGKESSEEDVDDRTRMEDERIKLDMNKLIIDYKAALNKPPRTMGRTTNYIPYSSDNRDDKKMLRKPRDQRDRIDDLEMEDDKKKIISREIDRFRLTHKDETDRDSAEREVGESKETSSSSSSKGSSDKERRRERDSDRERMRERDRERERDRDRERRKERERREQEERERERERLRREREKRERAEEERERDRERRREREREREREKDKMGSDEYEHERRKLERKLREKEDAYQERLKNWVNRERKRSRDHDKLKEKEKHDKVEMEKDKRSLHDFLEDYDDDKQDIKYYKGAALEKRREDRDKEMEADMRDRRREAEEIHEIKRRLKEEGSENLQEELARLEQERDGHKQRRLENVDLAKLLSQAKEQPKEVAVEVEDEGQIDEPPEEAEEEEEEREEEPVEEEEEEAVEEERVEQEPPEEEKVEKRTHHNLKPAFAEVHEESIPEPTPEPDEAPKETKRGMGFSGLKLGSSSSPNVSSNGKGKRKKKLTVEQVFNQDEDAGYAGNKKRKLVPIDYSEEEMKAVIGVAKDPKVVSNVAEEKRKSIKNLIEKIPTEKKELFAYQLDWSVVDNNLMERRIRPWINKKIVEYIGEEEPTLTDFICSKLLEHSGPETILNDITMVLDEEAEVFVVKMWRLLIYEVEAKKHGLVK